MSTFVPQQFQNQGFPQQQVQQQQPVPMQMQAPQQQMVPMQPAAMMQMTGMPMQQQQSMMNLPPPNQQMGGMMGPPPSVGAVAMPQVPQGLPQFQLPDEQTQLAAHQRAQQDSVRLAAARAGGGSGRIRIWTPPAPDGAMKWPKVVPTGFTSSGTVWLCPDIHPGRMPYRKAFFHFWKSINFPQGTSIPCLPKAGEDDGNAQSAPIRCPICLCKKILYGTQREEDAKKAQKLNSRPAYWFNMIWLDNVMSHVVDGKWVPWLLRAAQTLFCDHLDPIFGKFKISNIINPAMGRPMHITRKKDGPGEMDVTWTGFPLDAQPLPTQYYGPLYNLYDLDKIEATQPLTQEDAWKCIQDLQLPWVSEVQQLLSQLPTAASLANNQTLTMQPGSDGSFQMQQGQPQQQLQQPQQFQNQQGMMMMAPGTPGTQGMMMGGSAPMQPQQFQNQGMMPQQQQQFAPMPPMQPASQMQVTHPGNPPLQQLQNQLLGR